MNRVQSQAPTQLGPTERATFATVTLTTLQIFSWCMHMYKSWLLCMKV